MQDKNKPSRIKNLLLAIRRFTNSQAFSIFVTVLVTTLMTTAFATASAIAPPIPIAFALAYITVNVAKNIYDQYKNKRICNEHKLLKDIQKSAGQLKEKGIEHVGGMDLDKNHIATNKKAALAKDIAAEGLRFAVPALSLASGIISLNIPQLVFAGLNILTGFGSVGYLAGLKNQEYNKRDQAGKEITDMKGDMGLAGKSYKELKAISLQLKVLNGEEPAVKKTSRQKFVKGAGEFFYFLAQTFNPYSFRATEKQFAALELKQPVTPEEGHNEGKKQNKISNKLKRQAMVLAQPIIRKEKDQETEEKQGLIKQPRSKRKGQELS